MTHDLFTSSHRLKGRSMKRPPNVRPVRRLNKLLRWSDGYTTGPLRPAMLPFRAGDHAGRAIQHMHVASRFQMDSASSSFL